MESSRTSFTLVRNSADGRIGARSVLSKSCSKTLRKIQRKKSATDSLFSQIVGLQAASF